MTSFQTSELFDIIARNATDTLETSKETTDSARDLKIFVFVV